MLKRVERTRKLLMPCHYGTLVLSPCTLCNQRSRYVIANREAFGISPAFPKAGEVQQKLDFSENPIFQVGNASKSATTRRYVIILNNYTVTAS